jgi:chaperonin cofactor prefoldin
MDIKFTINKELLQEIEDYCELNEIEVSKTLNETLRSGFTILKFGLGPNTGRVIEKPVEVIKEVIKEVIREVPVDRIIEVEKIVEKIIEVEVPVDKIVEKNININVDGHKVNYMDYIEELNNNISKLEIEVKRITKELENSKNDIESLTKTKTELQIEIERLKKALKECKKDKGDRDFYGER